MSDPGGPAVNCPNGCMVPSSQACSCPCAPCREVSARISRHRPTLRELRTRLGMTMGEAARRLGCSVVDVSDAEHASPDDADAAELKWRRAWMAWQREHRNMARLNPETGQFEIWTDPPEPQPPAGVTP